MSPKRTPRGVWPLAPLCAAVATLLLTTSNVGAARLPAGHATPPPSTSRTPTRTPTRASAPPSPLAGHWRALTIDGPRPAAGAALAWDSADGVLFVFGGHAANGGANGLWAYRPTGTAAGRAGWTDLAANVAPAGRTGASLVWDSADGVLFLCDGAEGAQGSHETESLWAYKPGRGVVAGRGGKGAGRWVELPIAANAALPLRRAYHSAVWDDADGVMLLFGGETVGVTVGDTWAYRPAKGGLTTGVWTHIATTGPSPRQRAAAAWDSADGLMLLAGGAGYAGLLADLWAFRPARHGTAGSWIRLSAATPLGPREGAAAAWDAGSHRLLVFGGQLPSPAPTSAPRQAPTTPTSPTITPTGTSQGGAGPTAQPTATASATSAPPSSTPTNTATATNTPTASPTDSPTPTATDTPTNVPTATNTPTPGAPAAPARAGSAGAPPADLRAQAPLHGADPSRARANRQGAGANVAALDMRGSSLSSGKSGGVLLSPLSRARIEINPTRNRGETNPARNNGRNNGSRAKGPAALVSAQGTYAGDTWSYTPGRRGTGAGTWRPLVAGPAAPAARAAGVVFDAHDHALLLFGGQSASALDDVWSYPVSGPGSGRWALRDGGRPEARSNQAGAWDARDGALFVFGGFDGTWLDDLWAYKAQRGGVGHWTLVAGSGPAARTGASLVWDDADRVLLLFGGADFHGGMNDVWAYTPSGDGTGTGRWRPLTAPSSPDERRLHTAVWDGANRQMLVYAGETSTAVRHDLWSFRVTNLAVGHGVWRQLTPQATPGARFAQSAVWDPQRGQMLVFGGVNTAGDFLDDLWTYAPRGTTGPGAWTSLGAPGIPDGRATASAAWDPIDNALVLFGGTGVKGIRNDTYAYRPANAHRAVGGWSTLSPAGSPDRRNGATAVFDTVNNAVLLYGGTGAGGADDDLWQLGGAGPASTGGASVKKR